MLSLLVLPLMATVPPTAASGPAPRLEVLDGLVSQLTGGGARSVEPMPGGASTRCFFRVALGDERTAVAMYVPDGLSSDEVVAAGKGVQRWPFLEVRDLLESKNVRVPALLAEACDAGFILVEDLGDDTLARYLEKTPQARESLYRRAVLDLARAQLALDPLPEGSVVATRAFDETLLSWEVHHFREWALEARDIVLSERDTVTFAEAAEYLAKTIAGWPRGFVHRDYQSRNLMVVAGAGGEPELVWIDFQDALLGPRAYDLVALLNDSYQTFDREFIEARLDEFASHRSLDSTGRNALRREFDMITVQRKLKDAGRFVFIDRVRKNPGFLPFVEPTIAKVRAALERLTDDTMMVRLLDVLDRALP